MAVRGLEVESKGPQFHYPLGDAPSGILIVENIYQWEISDHRDVVCVEVVVKLPGGDEYSVE
jgi:hypothetical protein